jgi:hypothetical protein
MDELPQNIKKLINKKIDDAPNIEATDYSILGSPSISNAISNKSGYGQPSQGGNPFSSFGQNNNPYTNNNDPYSTGGGNNWN